MSGNFPLLLGFSGGEGFMILLLQHRRQYFIISSKKKLK
jgi:hypothetical protein